MHAHTSPPSFPFQLSSAGLRPNAHKTTALFSLPALRAGLGYVYTLAPTTTRARFRELGTPFVPSIQEGTIVLSVRVGFTDSQQEGEDIDQDSTVILRPSTTRKYVFRAWGRGWGVLQVLVEGEGGGSALGFVVPRDPLD